MSKSKHAQDVKFAGKYRSWGFVPKDESSPILRNMEAPIPDRNAGIKPSARFVPDTGTATNPLRYTGDAVIGISVVHKSCLQPVFSKEQAEDLAKMRR